MTESATETTPAITTTPTAPEPAVAAPAAAPQICTNNCAGECKCNPVVAPTFRSVTIQVPLTVTDEQVEMAVQMGSMAVNTIMAGGMQMFWPAIVTGPDGQKRQSIGQAQVPISSNADLQRLVGLASVIGRINMEKAKAAASGVAGAQLEAAITGENIKDNATRELTAQAEGRAGGIIIPK